MGNKKIIYFDYWTIGIKNFTLFDQKLKDSGFETKLLHLNSWKGIRGSEYQTIDNIDCYDIRYFKTDLLYKILEIEKPQAVIMLNACFITDRAVILACKKLGIKSVYFMHGEIMRDEFKEKTIESVNQRINGIQKIKKIGQHLNSTVANYLYSLWQYNWRYLVKIHPYKVLLKTFINPGSYLFFPPAAFDIKPDMALVYGELDREFLAKKFNDSDYVKVVGNPDLDNYFKTESQLGSERQAFFQSHNIPLDKPYITYIEEGIVENKFWTNEDRIRFINEIWTVCNEAGYNLVVKLHPRTAKGPNRGTFDALKNLVIVEEIDFPKLTYFTELCISHYSTTFVFPILLDKPILVPRWGKSANLITLNSEKDVTFVQTLEELRNRIEMKDFTYDRTEYLNNYVPFRDGKTSERAAGHILALIK